MPTFCLGLSFHKHLTAHDWHNILLLHTLQLFSHILRTERVSKHTKLTYKNQFSSEGCLKQKWKKWLVKAFYWNKSSYSRHYFYQPNSKIHSEGCFFVSRSPNAKRHIRSFNTKLQVKSTQCHLKKGVMNWALKIEEETQLIQPRSLGLLDNLIITIFFIKACFPSGQYYSHNLAPHFGPYNWRLTTWRWKLR